MEQERCLAHLLPHSRARPTTASDARGERETAAALPFCATGLSAYGAFCRCGTASSTSQGNRKRRANEAGPTRTVGRRATSAPAPQDPTLTTTSTPPRGPAVARPHTSSAGRQGPLCTRPPQTPFPRRSRARLCSATRAPATTRRENKLANPSSGAAITSSASLSPSAQISAPTSS
jgi:hypothetical protein